MHNLNVDSAARRREVAPGLDQPGWRRGFLRQLGVYIVLTALFTMVMVNFSLQHGRLAVGPTDDDCNYMVDALQRLHILFESPKQFVRSLIQFPPHSPFSTGLAMFAFLIFGPHQWAPYVCNGLVLLGLVLIVDYLVAPSGSEARIASILFTFSFAFTANVVTEFRPDCAAGITTALGVLLLMRTSPVRAGARNALLVGSLAALALLVKPTFAPFTVVTFGAAWLLSTFFVHVQEPGTSLRPTSLLRQLAWLALPTVLFALPYYLIHLDVVTYIQNQAFGRNKAAFELKESGMHVLRYYWDGAGGQMMLGRQRWVVVILALAAVVLLWNRVLTNWRRISAYIAVLVLTFAIPTFARMANPFFATPGDVLILLGAVLIVCALFDEATRRSRSSTLLRSVAWAAAGLSLLAFQWPPAHYDKGSEWARTVNRVGEQLYQTIRDHPGSRNARVFFTSPGPVDDMLLRYNGLVDNLSFWCPNRHLSRDPAIFRREIDAADFVVASEPGTGLVYENIVAPDVQNEMLQMALENAHLTELVKVPALNRKLFHVFVRRDLVMSSAGAKQVPFEDPWAALYGRE